MSRQVGEGLANIGTHLVCCRNQQLILWKGSLVPSLPEILMVLFCCLCSFFSAQYEALLDLALFSRRFFGWGLGYRLSPISAD